MFYRRQSFCNIGGVGGGCSGADPGFGEGGTPASKAESSWRSGVESRERSELSAAGVQGPLKGPGSFWVFSAQICILPHSRAPFSLISDIYIKTKNLQLLLNEKWYAERSEVWKFLNSNCKNSKILKKKYAERSEAKKISKKLDRAPKWSILGLKTWGQGGARAPGAPLDPLVML